MTAYPVCGCRNGHYDERNDKGAHYGETQELVYEIASEHGEPPRAPVCLADVVPVVYEQAHLLPAHEMVGIGKKEESESRKKRQYRSQGTDMSLVDFHQESGQLRYILTSS